MPTSVLDHIAFAFGQFDHTPSPAKALILCNPLSDGTSEGRAEIRTLSQLSVLPQSWPVILRSVLPVQIEPLVVLHYQRPDRQVSRLSKEEWDILTPNKSAIVPATLFRADDPATPMRKQNMMSIGRLSANAVPIFNTAYRNTGKGISGIATTRQATSILETT